MIQEEQGGVTRLLGRSSLVVLGQRYKVEYTDKLDVGSYGDTCSRSKKIRINCNASEDVQGRTLLHELCHAVLGESGIAHVLSEDTEEAVVTALEHGLYKLLK